MTIPILRVDCRRHDDRAALRALRQKLSVQGDIVSEAGRRKTLEVFGQPWTPAQVVEHLCREVRQRGLAAVLEYSAKLDQANLTAATLRVTPEELAAAQAQADPAFLRAVRRIRDNIAEFQQALLPRSVRVERPDGVSLEQRYVPLHRVGICVPGGAAAYPSTVLMTAVPAQTAGVEEIAVMAPPTRFGANNPDVLATCHELGIREVYRLGGAHGVAALAYGLEGVPAVDKIVGPGNLFVALAKKYVFGQVAIDTIAGPSEIVVIADHTARPEFVASDLLAQAEHAPGSSVLIAWQTEVLDAVAAELTRQCRQLEREPAIRASLEEFAALVLVRDAVQACEITDWLAPEHLEIVTESPRQLLTRIHNAGAIFLGNYSPVAIGDYAAGPSHVLPTSGTARWASGLTASDFLRGGSVISYTAASLAAVAEDAMRLAEKEELSAHRASLAIRLGDRATPARNQP